MVRNQLPAQGVNLQNCNIFSVLSIYLNVTQAKQISYFLIISIQVISTPTSPKETESDDFIVYGSVTRYGPRERQFASAVV